jgi:hypothetical protein
VTDPIRQLVTDLDAQGRPDFAWSVEWSPTGGDPLRPAWNASTDPRAMVALLARVAPREGVRAAVAVAKAACATLPDFEPRPLRVLACVERALAGHALDAARVHRWIDRAFEAHREDPRNSIAFAVAGAISAMEALAAGDDVGGSLLAVVDDATVALGHPRRYDLGCLIERDLAEVIRRAVAAPTLAQVLAARR